MNATEQSRLAALIELDTIPQWLREEIERRSNEIIAALESGRSITIHGPNGQSVMFDPGKKAVAA